MLVVANRDEVLDRPAEVPDLRPGGILAPRDIQAGGTWVGLNAHGVFVAITNRFTVAPPDPALLSRGAIVQRALEQESAAAAAEKIAGLDPTAYNQFHLAMADRTGAHVVWSDGRQLRSVDHGPGLFVISERSFGAAPTARDAFVEARIPELAAGLEPDHSTLIQLMASHHDPTFDGVCVHWDEKGYGTRMTTLVRLGAEPRDVTYLYTDGPPCTGPLIDVSATAQRLGELA